MDAPESCLDLLCATSLDNATRPLCVWSPLRPSDTGLRRVSMPAGALPVHLTLVASAIRTSGAVTITHAAWSVTSHACSPGFCGWPRGGEAPCVSSCSLLV